MMLTAQSSSTESKNSTIAVAVAGANSIGPVPVRAQQTVPGTSTPPPIFKVTAKISDFDAAVTSPSNVPQ